MACTTRSALLSAALLLLNLIVDPTRVNAACSAVAPAPEILVGAKGSIDRPFVVPGDIPGGGPGGPDGQGGRTVLTLDACQPPGAEFDKKDHVVAIVFTPPLGGTRNALLLAQKCTDVDTALCASQLGGGKVECVKTNVLVPGGTDKGKELAFDVPEIPTALGKLAGPAAVVVTKKDELRCDVGSTSVPLCTDTTAAPQPIFCVDDLSQGPCDAAVKHTLFPAFTVLPAINDFQKLCKDSGTFPQCASGVGYKFEFAIDKAGNALVPLRWRGILRAAGGGNAPCTQGQCDTRVLQGFTSVDPFPGDPAKEVIDLPAGSVKSYNMRGGEFTPPPTIHVGISPDLLELRVEGVAHKGKSVLRFPSGATAPNTYFDFRNRMQNGVGPVDIKRQGGPGVCDGFKGGKCLTDADCAPDKCGQYRAFALGQTPQPTVAPTPTAPGSPVASPPPPPPPPPPPVADPAILVAIVIMAIAIAVTLVLILRRRSRRS